MKKIIINLLSILILIVISSCDSTFEELAISPNQVALNSFFQTEEDANSAVIGIYGYITTPRNMGVNGSGIHLFRGDEFSNRHDYGWPGQHATISPSWYTIVQPYTFMYTAIYAANNVLNNVPNIEFSDNALKNAYLGEAHFWRAHAHFFLLNHYRNIIAVATDADPQSLQSQADPSVVWDLIISELQQAKDLLPNKGFWDADNKGRITAGAAAGLLGKVYLQRAGVENSSSDYALAAAEFNAIISGTYGSYSLVSNYDDNFTSLNENNDESLFEFQFRNSDPDNRGFNPGSVGSGTFGPATRGLAPPGFGQFSDAESVVNDWVLETFKASTDANGDLDKRAYSTLFFDGTDGSSPGGSVSNPPGFEVTGYEGLTFDQMYDGSSSTKTYPFVRQDNKEFFAANRKWLNLELTREEDLRKASVNLRVIRYADVLLMYSEAVLMGGSPGSVSVLDAVNQVRTRAGVPNLSSVTMNDVKTERVLELTGEGTRFLDLQRWGELSSVIKSREANYSNYKGWGNYLSFQDNKHEYLPIPITEIDANPNVVQNPGW